jgi:hypothetical protein
MTWWVMQIWFGPSIDIMYLRIYFKMMFIIDHKQWKWIYTYTEIVVVIFLIL